MPSEMVASEGAGTESDAYATDGAGTDSNTGATDGTGTDSNANAADGINTEGNTNASGTGLSDAESSNVDPSDANPTTNNAEAIDESGDEGISDGNSEGESDGDSKDESTSNAEGDGNDAQADSEITESSNATADDDTLSFQIGGSANASYIPVAVFMLSANGELTAVSTATTASIDDDVLSAALEELANASDGSGLLESVGLYYMKRTVSQKSATDSDPNAESAPSSSDASGATTSNTTSSTADANADSSSNASTNDDASNADANSSASDTEASASASSADETIYLAFADKSSASGWKSLAITLAGVGLVTLFVFFFISLLFVQWALKPVEESWRKQRQFVADASHELKTPLTVMLANAAILQRHPERTVASQSQWVESIETEAKNMQNLVGDMLFLASADDLTRARSFEPVDLSNLVERNLLQFESVAFERDIVVESKLTEGICIAGSELRLERLISTLLANAYKYAGAHGTVTVTLTRDARRIVLSVGNSGSPISAEDLPHIFDRFYRSDKARVRDGGGYGLGLAIAREVAEEHGGEIRARSTEVLGTVFTVEWDAKRTLSV